MDYLVEEVLQRQPARVRDFLLQTSVLDRLTGPLCDAVTGRTGSAKLLADLAHTTLLVDEYGGSFRYHSLLREFLRNELSAREPAVVSELHRRAAAWYEGSGDIDQAVGHAFAADDLDGAARLVGAGFLRYHWSARRATTRAWIERFE